MSKQQTNKTKGNNAGRVNVTLL